MTNPNLVMALLFLCWFVFMGCLYGVRVYYEYRQGQGLNHAYDHFKRLNPPNDE